MSALMKNKNGIIMGVANDKSIAWGIAKALAENGASITFTYQFENFLTKIEQMIQTLPGQHRLIQCDVMHHEQFEHLFASHASSKIDFMVHAIAFSKKNELSGEYINTSRHNFVNTMDISCYSLTAMCQYARKYLNENASILTLSYLGAERVMPNYNVMGVAKAALEASVKYLAVDLGKQNVRINTLSAGPIRTLAASGIDDFKTILKWSQTNSPIRQNVTLEEIAANGLYLLSDLSKGVTGQTLYVDNGYHVIGMKMQDGEESE